MAGQCHIRGGLRACHNSSNAALYVNTGFSPEILAAMVVGTLNMLTISSAMNSDYPIFAKLEEARVMFEHLICTDTL